MRHTLSVGQSVAVVVDMNSVEVDMNSVVVGMNSVVVGMNSVPVSKDEKLNYLQTVKIDSSTLVFVSGLTDGQSCQAIDSFLRGVYINVGEILNSDWLKSYNYFPYTPTQPSSKNVKKQEIL